MQYCKQTPSSRPSDDPPLDGLAKASHAPPADETGAAYAALSAELAACRLSAFRPESCQKPAAYLTIELVKMETRQIPGQASSTDLAALGNVERGLGLPLHSTQQVLIAESTKSMQQATKHKGS